MNGRIDVIVDRLRDRRSAQVVFLSHCLLNENTRYLGGACRPGCVAEIVQQCIARGIGIVQMPCPEQRVWGGVLKTRMLRRYGNRFGALLAPVWTWLAMRYTRLAYRRLAARTADDIASYADAGFTVLGVVGVDGSPSCGLAKTLDVAAWLRGAGELDPLHLTIDTVNELVRRNVVDGRGIFIAALERALKHRGLDVPLVAHDLVGELAGKPSSVEIPAAPP